MYKTNYDNEFCETTVNRSKSLKCSLCKKPLPMKTKVVFELNLCLFVGVLCMDCVEKDRFLQDVLADQRHTFDLDQ